MKFRAARAPGFSLAALALEPQAYRDHQPRPTTPLVRCPMVRFSGPWVFAFEVSDVADPPWRTLSSVRESGAFPPHKFPRGRCGALVELFPRPRRFRGRFPFLKSRIIRRKSPRAVLWVTQLLTSVCNYQSAAGRATVPQFRAGGKERKNRMGALQRKRLLIVTRYE